MPRKVDQVDELVELTDARAIRAIAHPARLIVIDRLYGEGSSLTATQAAELAGTTPSAMSYHLRALERFGIVRRADASQDGRERPWVRAAKDLRINPRSPSSSRGLASATGAVLAIAMDVTKQRMLAAVERSVSGRKHPLDAAVSYAHKTLLVTPEEATELLQKVSALLSPFEVDERSTPPAGAQRLAVSIAASPDAGDDDEGGGPVRRTTATSRSQ